MNRKLVSVAAIALALETGASPCVPTAGARLAAAGGVSASGRKAFCG